MLPQDAALDAHSYDAISRGISPSVRMMEVRSSNLRSWRQVSKKWCRTNASKKYKLGKKKTTSVFASNLLASSFAHLPLNDMIEIRRCMRHIEELYLRLTLQCRIG